MKASHFRFYYVELPKEAHVVVVFVVDAHIQTTTSSQEHHPRNVRIHCFQAAVGREDRRIALWDSVELDMGASLVHLETCTAVWAKTEERLGIALRLLSLKPRPYQLLSERLPMPLQQLRLQRPLRDLASGLRRNVTCAKAVVQDAMDSDSGVKQRYAKADEGYETLLLDGMER